MTSHFRHDYPIELLLDWTPGKTIIPLDWTPTQADKIITILGSLEEQIWTLYGDDLVNQAILQTIADQHAEQDDLDILADHTDDDIPF